LADVQWNGTNKTLQGTAKVIGGEPFKIVIANNGHKTLKAAATGAQFDLKPHSVSGLSTLTITADKTMKITWLLKYQ